MFSKAEVIWISKSEELLYISCLTDILSYENKGTLPTGLINSFTKFIELFGFFLLTQIKFPLKNNTAEAQVISSSKQ